MLCQGKTDFHQLQKEMPLERAFEFAFLSVDAVSVQQQS